MARGNGRQAVGACRFGESSFLQELEHECAKVDGDV
jgi:hypothetical protein